MSDDTLRIHSEAPYLGTATARQVPPPSFEASYLAKDYAGFRQLILDRLAQLIPAWQERHVPDVGIMLVELLAHLGDQLSYYQDAVATEAYLGTARRRISVRRHARLVDYPMHEGCNARAFVQIDVFDDCTLDLAQVAFSTRPRGVADWLLGEEQLREAPPGSYELFEPVQAARGELFTAEDVGDPSGLAQHPSTLGLALSPAERKILSDYLAGRKALRSLTAAGLAKKQTRLSERFPTFVATLVAGLNRQLSLPLAADRAFPAEPASNTTDSPPDPQLFLRGAALRRFQRHALDERLKPYLVAQGQQKLYQAHNRIPLHGPPERLGASLIDERSTRALKPQAGTPQKTRQRQKTYRRKPLRALRLKVGALLLFEQEPPGDRPRRHVVRITEARRAIAKDGTPLLAVTWGREDRLPDELLGEQIALVARGNVLLVDHGHTRAALTDQALAYPDDVRLERTAMLPGMDPSWRLAGGPIVFHQPLAALAPGETPPAARALMRQDPTRATPAISLSSAPNPWHNLDTISLSPGGYGRAQWRHRWESRRDLFESGPRDLHFVAEIDDAGAAWLRFGDGEYGLAPPGDASFEATVRVGGGPAGNVGADAISTLVYKRWSNELHNVRAVRNPLPATGGCPPESLDQVRLFAPDYFRTRLERAITAEDYAAIVMRDFAAEVQLAAATLRWTGVRYEVLVVLDPWDMQIADPDKKQKAEEDLCKRVRAHLEDYRRMGHDLAVELAEEVPVALTLSVVVHPTAWRGQVEAELRARFGDGEGGYFQRDLRSFGEGLALSEIYALAQAAPGVASVVVERLDREVGDPGDALVSGLLRLGPREVATKGTKGQPAIQLEGGR